MNLPEPAGLIPHGPSAVLVERILSYDGDTIACRVVPGGADRAYVHAGLVPAALAVEYMAQTIAVIAALRGRVEDRKQPGYVISMRDLSIAVTGFPVGEALTVRATWLWGAQSLARFGALIERDGVVIGAAQMSVYRPDPEPT